MSDAQTTYVRALLDLTKRTDELSKSELVSREGTSENSALADTYARRGSIYSDIGLAESGLADLLRAFLTYVRPGAKRDDSVLSVLLEEYEHTVNAQARIPAGILARLGECFRTYTRDVLLSRSRRGADADVARFIELSRGCFSRARAALEGQEATAAHDKRRAWILAHEAAVLTMQYWMSLSIDSPMSSAFEAAEAGFKEAERLYGDTPGYAWAKRFRAFLYALRGTNDERDQDYLHARMLLQELEGSSDSEQSSFDRSMAMLASYDVLDAAAIEKQLSTARPRGKYEKPRPEFGQGPQAEVARSLAAQSAREAAARESMERGFSAIHKDPEEFVAAFFAATSQWYLSKQAARDDERQYFGATLDAALDAAAIRANNALSQALMCLAGVHLLKALRGGVTGDVASAAARARDVLDQLRLAEPDLETRAMLHRNVLWSVIRNEESPEAREIRDVLGEGHFDDLKRLFSVAPRNSAHANSAHSNTALSNSAHSDTALSNAARRGHGQ